MSVYVLASEQCNGALKEQGVIVNAALKGLFTQITRNDLKKSLPLVVSSHADNLGFYMSRF